MLGKKKLSGPAIFGIGLGIVVLCIFLIGTFSKRDDDGEKKAISVVKSRYKPSSRLLEMHADVENTIWIAVQYPLCKAEGSNCWLVSSQTKVLPTVVPQEVNAEWIVDLKTTESIPKNLAAEVMYARIEVPAPDRAVNNASSERLQVNPPVSTEVPPKGTSEVSPSDSKGEGEVSRSSEIKDKAGEPTAASSSIVPPERLRWETQANGDEVMQGPSGPCATLILLSAHDPNNKLHLQLDDGSTRTFDFEDTPQAMRVGRDYCEAEFRSQPGVSSPQ